MHTGWNARPVQQGAQARLDRLQEERRRLVEARSLMEDRDAINTMTEWIRIVDRQMLEGSASEEGEEGGTTDPEGVTSTGEWGNTTDEWSGMTDEEGEVETRNQWSEDSWAPPPRPPGTPR